MNNPNQSKPVVLESAKVGTVVQEYMDNLLVELFPDVLEDTDVPVEDQVSTDLDTLSAEQSVVSALTVPDEQALSQPVTLIQEVVDTQEMVTAPIEEPSADVAPVPAPVEQTAIASPEVELELTAPAPAIETSVAGTPQTVETQAEVTDMVEATETAQQVSVYAKPEELRYPKAPVWAQQAFDALLFDVCGLKLAVPMESLGKIIKVDHETNQLIGRPDWFIGAYIDNEQHLYVVDTAQYIMPEKGFNLARDGFDYIIQLQRSKWTLACKKVHSTVRLEPDQVKWRSQQGKRQWLSGTVVDHMCALIHVDSLIELLEAEAS